METLKEKIDNINDETIKLGNLAFMKIDLNTKHGNFYLTTINSCVSTIRQSLAMISNCIDEYKVEEC